MSRYFPHTPYAEDQPLARTILTVHVLMRAITTGTIIGLTTASVRHLVRRSPPLPPAPTAAAGGAAGGATGVGAAAGGAGAVPVAGAGARAGAATSATATATAAGAARVPLTRLLLPAAYRGTVWTIGLVGVGLVGRMWGREEIEWQDRSWRLLENEGQLECDDWTVGGMGVGAVAAAAAAGGGAAGQGLLKRAVGGMGVGSLVGMAGYMGWRYGVQGGKFPDKNGSERKVI